MDAVLVSDHESVESSSSDEDSEREDVPQHRSGEGLGTPHAATRGGWQATEDVSDDGEMASAVASASQQANKFLEDSDSEEEIKEGPRCLIL